MTFPQNKKKCIVTFYWHYQCGYSVYAIGALEPGNYSSARDHSLQFNVAISSGFSIDARPYFLDSSAKDNSPYIKSLRCDATNSNID